MKITESQLRAVIKQELKKVLRENVQEDVDVQALINSFDELQYVYDPYEASKILKFKNGKKIGELTQEELNAIDEYMDENLDNHISLINYDVAAQAEIIRSVLKLEKEVSQYKHTEEEHLPLRLAKKKKEDDAYQDMLRKNDEYIKSRGLSESKKNIQFDLDITKVDVNNNEQVKEFATQHQGFKTWLAKLNLEVEPMMPGDYKGKGGLVDRYLRKQAAEGNK